MPIRRFRLIKQGLDDGSVLSDLNDVASTAPTTGDLLMWNGTEWVPSARGANPTGTVGLATVNGTALTYLRSDSAPALSQSIVPTWSAKHTFSVAPEFVSFELGSGATDTTFTRVSAGVAAIEGLNILTSATGLEPADIGVSVAAYPVLAAAINSAAATSGWVLTANGASGAAWVAVPAGVVGGNPTASVGLTAVNGVATTFLRSDGAPPLDVGIVPTWTAQHTFSVPPLGVDRKTAGAHWGSPSDLLVGDCANVVVYFERAATINSATVDADAAGSCVIDIWKIARTGLPASVANTITAAAKPTLSTARSSRDTTLTGWTLSVAAGDTLTFKVDSVSGIKQLSIRLNCQE